MQTVEYIRTVIDGPETLGANWELVANAANRLSDRYSAARAAWRWSDEAPSDFNASMFAANQSAGAGLIDDAMRRADKLCLDFPDQAHAWFATGAIKGQAGELDDAVAYLRKAWEMDDRFTGSWESIARLKRFTSNDPDLEIIAGQPAKAAALGPNFEISAHYACAESFDHLGDYDRAFSHFVAAARLVRQTSTYKFERQIAPMRQGVEAFDEQFLSDHESAGDPSRQPIFVIGPPRSGTTLVEQILASHQQVTGGGESGLLRVATWDLPNSLQTTVSAFARNGENGEQWHAMGQKYLAFSEEVFGAADRITNKDIGAISSVGVIRLILPNAKIVFVHRNAMDSAWSTYKAHFSSSIPWSFDFDEIARYHGAFAQAREAWCDRLGGACYNIHYEDLVADPTAQIDALLEFCDLSPEAACYDFHKTPRQISTASAYQVRQPLFKTSISGWKKYEKQLAPLRDAMDRYGPPKG